MEYDDTHVLQMINILKELLKYFEPAKKKQLCKFATIKVPYSLTVIY